MNCWGQEKQISIVCVPDCMRNKTVAKGGVRHMKFSERLKGPEPNPRIGQISPPFHGSGQTYP